MQVAFKRAPLSAHGAHHIGCCQRPEGLVGGAHDAQAHSLPVHGPTCRRSHPPPLTVARGGAGRCGGKLGGCAGRLTLASLQALSLPLPYSPYYTVYSVKVSLRYPLAHGLMLRSPCARRPGVLGVVEDKWAGMQAGSVAIQVRRWAGRPACAHCAHFVLPLKLPWACHAWLHAPRGCDQI